MKNDLDKEILMKRRFAVATYALSNNVARTKSYAERVGIVFNEERILSDVENIFGSDAVKALREWWDEAHLVNFDQMLDNILNLKIDELIAEKSKVSDFAQQPKSTPVVGYTGLVRGALIAVTYTIRELLNPLNNPSWSSQDLALMGATRGGAFKRRTADSTSSPEIDPSLSVEEDTLVIWLRLRTVGLAFLKTSDVISLYVNGESYSDFIFHRESDDTIALETKLGNRLITNLIEGNLSIKYTGDLSKVSVYLD